MEVKCLRVGELRTNCYLIWDEDTFDCFIIDPGDDADFITTEILQLKLKPQAILLTHGHYDHCLACLELKLNFNVPIYLDPKDNFLYQNASKSAGHWSKQPVIARSKTTKQSPTFKQPPTVPFPKNIKLGNTTFKVIHTPGHTPGSCSFLVSPVKGRSGCAERGSSALFVGDTIFEDGVGRTDFSYSSASDLKKSISQIRSFPENTLLYPGHENTPFFLSTINNS